MKHEVCRIGGGKLIDVLDLGDIYLNDFLAPGDSPPEAYPLTLCYSPESELVQLRHTVDPELMYRRYWYNSGTNESMVRHLREIVSRILENVSLKHGDIVVDIGCNDGTLLAAYPKGLGLQTFGFDPAENLSPHATWFVNDFFTSRAYNLASLPRTKVVTSIAMFYDIEKPVEFACDVNQILHDEGLWVLEMHYLPKMLEHAEVDAICHEHLMYYSLKSLSYVLHQAGFEVVDVELNNTNGGSMLVLAKKKHRASSVSPRVRELLDREAATPIRERLEIFSKQVKENKTDLRILLESKYSFGYSVLGYGASTKGNTLLQYCEIGPDLLPYIADRNPAKWGRKTVGSNIPIISEEEARSMLPDYFFALPYHFIDSFMKRESDFLNQGGRFIVPVPTPRVFV